MTPRTVHPRLDPAALEDLSRRLAATRWPAAPGGAWELGVPDAWLRELVADWQAYDTARLQERLDALTHLEVEVDGQRVHLVHAPGTGPDPVPLVLTHGWPGSVLEHLDLLPLLADAFTVVLPSLPGHGFSGPPPAGGLTARQVAHLWHRVVTEGLGHDRYAAHGSDLGAGVTAWLARDHPDAVTGIHPASPFLPPPPEPWSPAEAAHVEDARAWTAEHGGYAHEHATRPATLGAALLDSPVGLAAWVGEKVHAWSSPDEDGGTARTREFLLATLTLYWATGTVGTSLLPYWVTRHVEGALLPGSDPSPVPTWLSMYGGERVPLPKPPRELAERSLTVAGWAEHDRGGHFPSVAAPQLLARTLREALG